MKETKVQVPETPPPKQGLETAKPTRAESQKAKSERRESAVSLKQQQKLQKHKMKRERKQRRQLLRELTNGSEPWFEDIDDPQDHGVFRRIMDWFRC
jgi:hypothetical protein